MVSSKSSQQHFCIASSSSSPFADAAPSIVGVVVTEEEEEEVYSRQRTTPIIVLPKSWQIFLASRRLGSVRTLRTEERVMTRLRRIVMLSHWKKGLHSDYYSESSPPHLEEPPTPLF